MVPRHRLLIGPSNSQLAEFTAWQASIAANSGTVSAGSMDVVKTLIKAGKAHGWWSKCSYVWFPCGDFAATPVALKATLGTQVMTLSGVTSANYSESQGVQVTSPNYADTGVNATSLDVANVSIGMFARGTDPTSGSNNILGAQTAFNEFGIIHGQSNSPNGANVFNAVVKNRNAASGLWMGRAAGFTSLTSDATGVRGFKNGYIMGRNTAGVPTGPFSSNTVRMPCANNGARACGGFVSTALTDAEMLALVQDFTTANAALGRTDTETNKRYQLIGDSLTYGYTTGSAQVTQPYFVQLGTTRGWGRTNADVFMLGIIGQTAETVLTNISQYTERYYPLAASGRNVAIVWLGTNDLLTGKTATQALASLEGIGTALRAAGISVVWVTLSPAAGTSYTGSANYNTHVGALNTDLKTAAKWTNGTAGNAVAVIDTLTELQDPNNTTYFLDGLHLTNAAYTPIASTINTALVNASLT